MKTIEEPHINGGQREKEDEGKEDPGELNGEFKFSRYDSKSGVEKSDEGIGKDDSGSDNQKEGNEKEGVDVAGEAECGLFSLLSQFLGEGGDEGGRKCALSKQIAEKVGDAECGDEGIELLACPKEGVQEDFAD
jgi:hypothetical protein